MTEFELGLDTDEQRKAAILAFAGVFGGGVIGFEAARAIRDGDLFAMDPLPAGVTPKAAPLVMFVGLGLLGAALHEASKEVGWKPLLLGSAAVLAGGLAIRAIRG